MDRHLKNLERALNTLRAALDSTSAESEYKFAKCRAALRAALSKQGQEP